MQKIEWVVLPEAKSYLMTVVVPTTQTECLTFDDTYCRRLDQNHRWSFQLRTLVKIMAYFGSDVIMQDQKLLVMLEL